MLSLYLPQQSWLHRLPAGLKLLTLALTSIALYQFQTMNFMVPVLIATLAIYLSMGKTGLHQLKVIRPLILLFVFLFLFQGLTQDWTGAFLLLGRMLILIWLAHLITLTTRIQQMLDVVTPLFSPLKWIGMRPDSVAFSVILLIRFVPVLLLMLEQLQQAWQSRKGGRQQWKLATPLLINAIRMSDQVSDALAARGGIPRKNTGDTLER